jgi:hypothetical protein
MDVLFESVGGLTRLSSSDYTYVRTCMYMYMYTMSCMGGQLQCLYFVCTYMFGLAKPLIMLTFVVSNSCTGKHSIIHTLKYF